MFHTASGRQIRRRRTADVCFWKAQEILEAEGVRKRVKAEFVGESLPPGYDWGIPAGIEEVPGMAADVEVNGECVAEGTFFRDNRPAVSVAREYDRLAALETAILGLLCQASAVAAKAARCTLAAAEAFGGSPQRSKARHPPLK